ncbi:hypothetical protein VE03_03326 [Pseudogymnoascus sp. 23342-1-I1]|nr:hypothetical protein VE03_03326 [Pseudogymnoascus sp. 23342-1-I1]
MLLLPGRVFGTLGAILQLACCHQQIQPLSSHISLSPTQNNQVYILGSSRTGIAVITAALQTLGYKQILLGTPPVVSADHASDQGTFSVVSVELGIEEHSIMSPAAKFILPVEDDKITQIEYPNVEGFSDEQGFASGYQNYIRSVQDFFAQSDQEAKLLVFQIRKNSHRVGDDWPKLCQFLGLGYSVVERYRLRQFPQGHEEAWTL